MSYGLEVWDATGKARLQVTDRLSRRIQMFSGSFSAGATGSVDRAVTGLAANGTWGIQIQSTVGWATPTAEIFPGFVRIYPAPNGVAVDWSLLVFRW